jgi:DNA-binding CsgD family transcriptional regulator
MPEAHFTCSAAPAVPVTQTAEPARTPPSAVPLLHSRKKIELLLLRLATGGPALRGDNFMHTPSPDLQPSDYLTARQKKALICAAKDMTNSQIAAHLFVGQRTVDRDLKVACEVFGVQTRSAALLRAYLAGVVTDEHLVDGAVS